ncbi:DHCW motif cupin fold protein [Maridesulfovibrio frigidus]|uniref:DHCW motif cupin fold protein n=1 Tax=Maridesulfovibrio frigidus TaxID=340956 RepID=UPI0004E16158|nr:DHCW motif cupin fold protein [Maridesulfovibrio frigidus]
MKMDEIPFCTTDWNNVEKTEHKGETGVAYWRTRLFGPSDNQMRVRMVEYSAGYLADHWCSKGHVLFCMAGQLETTLEDGRKFTLTPGMSYQVADNAEAHQSYTEGGATLFVVD